MSEKFTLMVEEKANHTTNLMARLLKVSRAGYYAWLKRGGPDPAPGPRATRRAVLAEAVTRSHTGSHGVNGHRRVRADHAGQGVVASEWSIRQTMSQLSLCGGPAPHESPDHDPRC